ncbi:MAG: hypothetical protein F6J98_02060 [Moorea sp. SIO4G2]|nr:hypothetical protein [Moorena sp. SIO4G2]
MVNSQGYRDENASFQIHGNIRQVPLEGNYFAAIAEITTDGTDMYGKGGTTGKWVKYRIHPNYYRETEDQAIKRNGEVGDTLRVFYLHFCCIHKSAPADDFSGSGEANFRNVKLRESDYLVTFWNTKRPLVTGQEINANREHILSNRLTSIFLTDNAWREVKLKNVLSLTRDSYIFFSMKAPRIGECHGFTFAREGGGKDYFNFTAKPSSIDEHSIWMFGEDKGSSRDDLESNRPIMKRIKGLYRHLAYEWVDYRLYLGGEIRDAIPRDEKDINIIGMFVDDDERRSDEVSAVVCAITFREISGDGIPSADSSLTFNTNKGVALLNEFYSMKKWKTVDGSIILTSIENGSMILDSKKIRESPLVKGSIGLTSDTFDYQVKGTGYCGWIVAWIDLGEASKMKSGDRWTWLSMKGDKNSESITVSMTKNNVELVQIAKGGAAKASAPRPNREVFLITFYKDDLGHHIEIDNQDNSPNQFSLNENESTKYELALLGDKTAVSYNKGLYYVTFSTEPNDLAGIEVRNQWLLKHFSLSS